MLSIIVPYRDREEHLKQFIPHLYKYIPSGTFIAIVEQCDEKAFNRGKLLNIGAIECPSEFLCFHDVDMLPVKVNYNERIGVQQLATSEIQKQGYLGGVTMFDMQTFKRVGGYHNDYFHRAEDNEMMFHLKHLKIPVYYRTGTFVQLPHGRPGPEFIPELWEKAQLPRAKNMLETCKYELISKEIRCYESKTPYIYIHIKVAL